MKAYNISIDHIFYGDFEIKREFALFCDLMAKTSKFLILTPYGKEFYCKIDFTK